MDPAGAGLPADAYDWTVEDVGAWLVLLGLPTYATVFRAHEVRIGFPMACVGALPQRVQNLIY